MKGFTMQGKVADGGYSIVYKCTNRVGTTHICKVIPKVKLPAERVRQEVAAMEKLQRCVFVPRLIEYFEDNESHYIVQEYCKGAPLETKEHDEFAACVIARELLRGLYELHEAGVIHCDIKQGNIIFNKRDYTLKIIDYGNSQLAAPPVKVENLVGTPLFMAPEQLSHTCTFETDVWSVGIVVHHMLSGMFPFDTYKEIFTNEPEMRGLRWKDMSADAKEFIRLCLKKEYHQRPSIERLLHHPWLGL